MTATYYDFHGYDSWLRRGSEPPPYVCMLENKLIAAEENVGIAAGCLLNLFREADVADDSELIDPLIDTDDQLAVIGNGKRKDAFLERLENAADKLLRKCDEALSDSDPLWVRLYEARQKLDRTIGRYEDAFERYEYPYKRGLV